MLCSSEDRPTGPRNLRGAIVISLLWLGSAAMAAAQAQSPQKLPTANEVLQRNIEATGGEDALLRHKSMTVHGRYQVPAAKLDVETVFYMKDGKLLWRATLPGGATASSGYDGHTAWNLDGSGKATVQTGDEVLSVARDADMYYHLHVMKYFKSMEVVDVREFNGRQCYHLKGATNWGRVNEHFYDVQSGLLQGYAFNTAWRGGKGDATETFENYKSFGGVLMPTKTTSREGDELAISLVTSVTYDDVDDAVFALPAAVKNSGKK
ncbi:MAG TPA: hypothetical protein VLW48_02940 [Candidatus Bathyarchaeia archaeon]|nr:hypothetical protein [Candidatus Bathyarchaeia archaeon]